MNVSDQIFQILKNVDVMQIWGVTGDALNTFTDALRDNKDIKYIMPAFVCNTSIEM